MSRLSHELRPRGTAEEPLTCRHGHGGPRDHAHGHAVGPGRSHGGRVDRRRDAVGLHHGGVMDDVRLRRVHRLGVVSSLLERGKTARFFLAPGTRRCLYRGKRSPAPSGCQQHAATAAPLAPTPKKGQFGQFFLLCSCFVNLCLFQSSPKDRFNQWVGFFSCSGNGTGISITGRGQSTARGLGGMKRGPSPKYFVCRCTKRARGGRNEGEGRVGIKLRSQQRKPHVLNNELPET